MIFALLGALAVGLSLGLLGAGGSVITTPVLIILLQRPEKLAIAESLAVIGNVALAGAIPYIYRGQVKWSAVLFFGVPGMIGACLGGCGPYFLSANIQLVFFGLIAVAIGFLMFFNESLFDKITGYQPSILLMIIEGFFIGCLTGFLGVGGGFLIVPSLMILCSLAISVAVGTSLMIITLNAWTGFLNQYYYLAMMDFAIDWSVIVMISAAGIFGSIFGGSISPYVSQKHLRKTFGLSVICLGGYLLLRNI